MHLILLSILIACAFGTRRFVFDNDNDFKGPLGHVALAINVCFKPFAQEAIYYKYTCSGDGTTVIKKEYSDAVCSGDGALVTSDPPFPEATSPCGTPVFECDTNAVDDYAMVKIYVEFSANACDTPMVWANLPVVVGSCYCNKASQSYHASCTSESVAALVKYSDNTCGTKTDSIDLASCTPEADVSGFKVSYKIEGCHITPTQEPTASPAAGVSVSPSRPPTAAPVASPSVSPVTSAPTISTNAPTQPPTAVTQPPVPAPADPTRFVLDDDWVLGELYPFPMDMCLQMKRKMTLMTYESEAEFTYYECNDAGNVDKYKWTIDTEPSIGNDFTCADRSTAVKSEFVFDSSKTNCDAGYFECGGDDNYVAVSLSTQFVINADLSTWDCNKADNGVLDTTFATGVCFCNRGAGLSNKVTCDSTEALIYNYTGTECGSLVAQQRVGGAGQCAHFISFEIRASGMTLDLPLAGLMDTCVQAGQDVILETEKPTYVPSDSPSPQPTIGPTSPTQPTPEPTTNIFGDGASWLSMQLNVMCTWLMALALYPQYR